MNLSAAIIKLQDALLSDYTEGFLLGLTIGVVIVYALFLLWTQSFNKMINQLKEQIETGKSSTSDNLKSKV